MDKMTADYETFLYDVSNEMFEKKAIAFVKNYLPLNIKEKGYADKDLRHILYETIKMANRFMIYSQMEILKLFFLTLLFGIDFYNFRKFIFIEAELNNIRNDESERIKRCCDILTEENYLDPDNALDKELYQLLKLKYVSPIPKFDYRKLTPKKIG